MLRVFKQGKGGVLLIIAGSLFFWYWWRDERVLMREVPVRSGIEESGSTALPAPRFPTDSVSLHTKEDQHRVNVSSQVIPFTVQAPTGKWSDPVFQNGCEEASVLMVSRSGNTGVIEAQDATRAIMALSRLSQRLFGTAVDTSAQDTLTLYRHFTGKENAGFLLDPATPTAMQAALAQGSVLIVPMNGRALGNPHFTAPGPETHMLVVTRYDESTKEYVTQDPGTRYGAEYRYPESVFVAAMRDYPTGDHLPVVSVYKRAIVLGQEDERALP